MDPSLKQREEEKRERASDPVKRWKQIQSAITWAEANMKPEFRRNVPCGFAGVSRRLEK